MQTIEVKITKELIVAGIFIKKQNFLITSRPKGKIFEGLWEFPGGKVKKNECLEFALKREIKEEINIDINESDLFFFQKYNFLRANKKLTLNFFICKKWSGKLMMNEGQSFKWTNIKNICQYNFLKSNKKVLKKLTSVIIPHY